MKRQICIIFLSLEITLMSCAHSYGFGNKSTHPALTQKAVTYSVLDNYLKTQLGIDEGLNAEFEYNVDMYNAYIKKRMEIGGVDDAGNTTRTALNWMKAGSNIEDEDGIFLPSIRSRHHFYDPTCSFQDFNEPGRNAGLDNKTDHPIGSWGFRLITSRYTEEFDVTGQSARTWMIEGFAAQEPKVNNQAWIDARKNFEYALTMPNKSWREEHFAMMFLDLGCVLHMIEDMGVPAHTRNDFILGHLQYKWPLKIGNPLEMWVEEQIIDNNDQSLWSGSEPIVFDKLARYFDTDTYTGSYLGDGVTPPDEWGLAECTNYQFLSLSTVFGCSGIKYQFPHPAMGKTTLFLVSVPDGLKGYFDGSNYGVTHLARDSYTRYKGARHLLFGPSLDRTITTDDVSVFTDYAEITIPRTIDYTTGLINYFFRGSLDVSIGCPQGCNPNTNSATYSMTITNTSINTDREQVLKGGTFEFYWEDLSGNRTEANDFTVYTYDEFDPNTTELWDQNSILPYGEYIKATASFNVSSCTDIVNYAVVYKGAINDFEYPDDTDIDDANAIACWVKSESNSVPASSYTLLVTEWGGTDEYYECAEYLKSIFDSENPDGYTLAKAPDSTCFDCRWRCMDYHTCPYGSPYCYTGCNVIQIMIINSAATDEFCVIMTPFPVAYCGFGPLCNGSYKRCFSKQPGGKLRRILGEDIQRGRIWR